MAYSEKWIKQIKYRVIMTKEEIPKVVNFITSGAGFFNAEETYQYLCTYIPSSNKHVHS